MNGAILNEVKDTSVRASKYLLYPCGTEPVFFSDDMRRGKRRVSHSSKAHTIPNEHNSIVNHQKIAGANGIIQMIPSQQRQYPSLPIGICFLIGSKSFQCERCLALHSTAFGVRAYDIKAMEHKESLVLISFVSIHRNTIIQKNCESVHCVSMEHLSDEARGKLNGIFPMHNEILQEVGASSNRNFWN